MYKPPREVFSLQMVSLFFVAKWTLYIYIYIPIRQHKKTSGTLKLDEVLIVPNLDRRFFPVNTFLSKGNNWVHFTQHSIELGIKGGPKLTVPITFSQTNAMVVNVSKQTQPSPSPDTYNNKLKISTDTFHSRIHRSHGALATIKSHNLLHDVNISQGSDQLCISCKIMSIPAVSRRKHRTSHVFRPSDEIQVGTVPNPEPVGLSSESRCRYYLIYYATGILTL